MNEPIQLLYQDYINNRKKRIPADQFMYIAKLYPAILVCMGDGVLDLEEWDGIVMATRGLASEFVKGPEDNKDMIAMSFRTEIRYLTDNVDKWKKKFLSALHSYLKIHPEDKDFVLDSMYLFANIADGISDDEQAVINQLAYRLEIIIN